MFGSKKRNVATIVGSLSKIQTELEEVVNDEEIFQKERQDEIKALEQKVEVSVAEADEAKVIAGNISALLNKNV